MSNQNKTTPIISRPLCAALTICAALGLSAAARAQYTVIDLQPADGSYVSTRAQGIAVGQPVGFGYAPSDLANYRALMWSGTAGTLTDMHPSALLDYPALNAPGRSMIVGSDGSVQGGFGSGVPTAQHDFAIRWAGTPDSAEFLFAPFETLGSRVNGVGDGQQVGHGFPALFVSGARGTVKKIAGPSHALLWTTGSSIAVDLHNGADTTVAVACAGGKQVGYGAKTDAFGNVTEQKAMLWAGNRNSFVWLHPGSGFATSEAVGISGSQQVGFGAVNTKTLPQPGHALLWTGTAASVVDLHPSGFTQSFALSCANAVQVGYAIDAAGLNHAIAWSGTAGSALDLNQFLPAGYSAAAATGIDAAGRISGYVSDASGSHAIIWAPSL